MLKKSLSDLIDNFIPKELQHEFPMYKKFIQVYLEYLDSTIYEKISNLLLNNDPDSMYPELLNNYFSQFFHNIIDIEKYGLTDENKKLYIELSKIIIGLKGTKNSIEFLFNALDEFQVFGGGTIPKVEDYEYSIKDDSWDFTPTGMRKYPYTYRFNAGNEFPTKTLVDIVQNIHPAGFNFDFIIRKDKVENVYVEDLLKIRVEDIQLYNGEYSYNGSETYGQVDIDFDDFLEEGIIPNNGLKQLIFCIAKGRINNIHRNIEKVSFGISSTHPNEFSTISDVSYSTNITDYDITNNSVTFNWFLNNQAFNKNIFTFGLIDGEENNLVAVRYKDNSIKNNENKQIYGSHTITFMRVD